MTRETREYSLLPCCWTDWGDGVQRATVQRVVAVSDWQMTPLGMANLGFVRFAGRTEVTRPTPHNRRAP
ncbi:MAG: hypothetical protein AAGI03_09125 [Pseudomonadota bacterium]